MSSLVDLTNSALSSEASRAVREQFRARLKSDVGPSHRDALLAFAFWRGKPYSFAEPVVMEKNLPLAYLIAKVFGRIVEGDDLLDEPKKAFVEKVQSWLDTTRGRVKPGTRRYVPPGEKKPAPPARLYVLVRRDITDPAYRAVQAMHAGIDFCIKHRDIAESWHASSNTLCLIEVDDERTLHEWKAKMDACRKTSLLFSEPDLDNQLTSLAIEPAAAPLLKGLPTARMLLLSLSRRALGIEGCVSSSRPSPAGPPVALSDVAQLVERWASSPRCAGSIPVVGTACELMRSCYGLAVGWPNRR
jgi:hypothetical protein